VRAFTNLQHLRLLLMRVFGRFSTAVIVAAIFFLQCDAVCQEPSSDDRNWDFSIWATGATGEENTNSLSEAQLVSAGVFVGKTIKHDVGSGWRRGYFEYAASLSPVFLQLGPRSLHGIEFDPVILRWNSNLRFGRAAPYIELAGGGVQTNRNFPAGDTSDFNFTVRGGGGVYLPAKSNRGWDAGVRWTHISNANLGTQNPEFNGVEIRLAYHWYR